MPGHTDSDDPDQTVRRDIERGRRTGAPLLGHLAGLHRTGAPADTFVLAFDLARPALAGGPGIAEVAVLADLALGGVLRTRVGLTVPLPTISMALQLHPGRMSGIAAADAEVTALAGRTALARARLRTGTGAVLGDAHAVFGLPALPYDGPGRPMPWDAWPRERRDDGAGRPPVPPPSDTDPAAGPRRLPRQIAAHAANGPDRAWASTHVRDQMTDADPDVVLSPTPAMANRRGHVQGGVLLAAAVIAAELRGGAAVADLVRAGAEFVDAARLDAPVTAAVRVLRRTGRSSFISVVLAQDDRTCCHVTTVFRR